jgi:hypothetical protein
MQLFKVVTANDASSAQVQQALQDLNTTPAVTFYVLGPGEPLSTGNFWGAMATCNAPYPPLPCIASCPVPSHSEPMVFLAVRMHTPSPAWFSFSTPAVTHPCFCAISSANGGLPCCHQYTAVPGHWGQAVVHTAHAVLFQRLRVRGYPPCGLQHAPPPCYPRSPTHPLSIPVCMGRPAGTTPPCLSLPSVATVRAPCMGMARPGAHESRWSVGLEVWRVAVFQRVMVVWCGGTDLVLQPCGPQDQSSVEKREDVLVGRVVGWAAMWRGGEGSANRRSPFRPYLTPRSHAPVFVCRFAQHCKARVEFTNVRSCAPSDRMAHVMCRCTRQTSWWSRWPSQGKCLCSCMCRPRLMVWVDGGDG